MRGEPCSERKWRRWTEKELQIKEETEVPNWLLFRFLTSQSSSASGNMERRIFVPEMKSAASRRHSRLLMLETAHHIASKEISVEVPVPMLINVNGQPEIEFPALRKGVLSSKTQSIKESPSASSMNGTRLANQLKLLEIQQSADPISEINLRETSDFVRSFPAVLEKKEAKAADQNFADEEKLGRKGEVNGVIGAKKSEWRNTPSRTFNGGGPVKEARTDYHKGRPSEKYMLRWKPFSSKWDDAEKWLINSSPAHPHTRNCQNALEAQTIMDFRDLQSLQSKKPTNDQFCNVYDNRLERVDVNKVAAVHEGNKHNIFPDILASRSEIPVDERANFSFQNDCRDIRDASSTVSSSAFSTEMNLSGSFDSSSSHIGASAPDFPIKDKFTDKVVPAQDYRYNSKAFHVQDPKHARLDSNMKDAATEISPTVSVRDMGTQVSPLGSSLTSPSQTPVKKASSPTRHNTPARTSALMMMNHSGVDITELQSCHLAKLQLQGLSAGSQFADSFDKSISNWSSREEEEEDISKSLRHFDFEDCKYNDNSLINTKAAAWEEAERSKYLIRYHQEETKIRAWEEHQKAKAEAQLKKLEVKIEKMRSNMKEKMRNKVVASQRRAEEWRAVAQAQHVEQIARTSERAERMRRDSDFSPTLWSCSCFSLASHS